MTPKEPPARPARFARFLSQAGLVALSALAGAAAFPPLEWSALAWISLAPLFLVFERTSSRWGFLWAYVHGVIFYTAGLWWFTEVSGLGLAVTVFHLGFFQVTAGLPVFVARKRLRLPYVAVAGAAWVGMEYLRSFVLTGFAWLYLGHTQWRSIEMIQISDATGAYGVSFLVATAGGAAADLVIQWRSRSERGEESASTVSKRRWHPWVTVAVPLFLVVAANQYGAWRIGQEDFRIGPRVAIVQGNISQALKKKKEVAQPSISEVMEIHLALSIEACCSDPPPDLLVWPETMVPGYLDSDPVFFSQLQDLARTRGVRLLVGSNSYEPLPGGEYRKGNSCFYFDEEGRLIGRYDKIHLVPVGEYNPYAAFFPRTNEVIFGTAGFLPDLSPGEAPYVGKLTARGETSRFGVLVCYEEIFPALVRSFCEDDVDFLVLATNDAWWGDSFEYEQFLAIGVFRAIENRVSLVRAGNTGISCVIDPAGRIPDEAILRVDGQWKNVRGHLVADVPIDGRRSPYSIVGDLFARVCLGGTGFALVLACIPRSRRSRPT
ncbi:MAG: apolipoprotein N-acyltransferase [Planctomycetes bacterium]|nr:apolipoprotein N-acyltransferase [Planctomycetota bacterium]